MSADGGGAGLFLDMRPPRTSLGIRELSRLMSLDGGAPPPEEEVVEAMIAIFLFFFFCISHFLQLKLLHLID